MERATCRLGAGARYDASLTALRQLRYVALAEGTSFLVLLFVAMPLKYLAGQPLAVRVVGSVHGALFLAFVLALIWVSITRNWPMRRSLLAFVSSIVPFGTFAFDRSLRREIAAAAAGRGAEVSQR
jgi:integral membrane protein